MYPGRQILHLPTVKTHGHAVMTGSVKNSFGGLLKEVRHYAHKYMHEVLVDLLYMQRELHPAVFTVMDGTVAGDGAGPRTMIPRVKNLILAASDSVAIDAIAARLMGFDPLSIPFLRMAHERGLGIADPRQIELVGDDVSHENFGFTTRKSLVIWGDQMIRKGFLRPLERVLLHSPLMVWAPLASNVYHDLMWYPTIGQSRIREFMPHRVGEAFQKVLTTTMADQNPQQPPAHYHRGRRGSDRRGNERRAPDPHSRRQAQAGARPRARRCRADHARHPLPHLAAARHRAVDAADSGAGRPAPGSDPRSRARSSRRCSSRCDAARRRRSTATSTPEPSLQLRGHHDLRLTSRIAPVLPATAESAAQAVLQSESADLSPRHAGEAESGGGSARGRTRPPSGRMECAPLRNPAAARAPKSRGPVSRPSSCLCASKHSSAKVDFNERRVRSIEARCIKHGQRHDTNRTRPPAQVAQAPREPGVPDVAAAPVGQEGGPGESGRRRRRRRRGRRPQGFTPEGATIGAVAGSAVAESRLSDSGDVSDTDEGDEDEGGPDIGDETEPFDATAPPVEDATAHPVENDRVESEAVASPVEVTPEPEPQAPDTSLDQRVESAPAEAPEPDRPRPTDPFGD